MKRSYFILICMLLCGSWNHYAQKVATKSGVITFEASVASFEEVKATHANVSAILNTETGSFASLALVNGFRFKVALMEEHFNENYMESATYSKATVKGVLEDFNSESLTSDFTSYNLKGTIEMHGVENELNVPVRIKLDGDALIVETNFELKPEDFDIEIPSVVANKIAQTVVVNAQYTLNKL
ncbi:MAG: YceI family protein [Gilvibacter sp.]